MRIFYPRERPKSWRDQKASSIGKWALPFTAGEWALEWAAYLLSNWKFLEVLEFLGLLLRDPRVRIIEVSEYAALRDFDRGYATKLVALFSEGLGH